MSDQKRKIVLPGGAGLVGQNLLACLADRDDLELVVIDKHRANLALLRRMHPRVQAVLADLADPGRWMCHVDDADVIVLLQAQIGGTDPDAFLRNNILSVQNILAAVLRRNSVPLLIHVSSSVVESVANDDYTASKRRQEEMIINSGIPCVTLRPTLMFGWFDRKHLGWLSRFMKRVPLFPVPGDGRFMRQPLYAGDFCRIIISCIDRDGPLGTFNISGRERIDYIDMIRMLKRTIGAPTIIMCIPYRLFYWLLRLWALFDRDPPFTAAQLEALCAGDEFELIDWPEIFGVASTPLAEAFSATFTDPRYSRVELEF